MKTNTRRRFIRNTSLTATGLFLTSVTKAKNDSILSTAIGCGPNQTLTLFGTVTTKKSGNWSDPSTWGGKVPGNTDTPLIVSGHSVICDIDAEIAGLNIEAGATLKFSDNQSASIQSTKNIVVNGLLEMTPSSASVNHLIQFTNIDESKVVGGGHMVLATDIGLWVTNSGKLNLIGTPKQSWTNLSGSVSKGSTAISLKSNPKGWATGDEIVICPTQSVTDYGRERTIPLFERVNITDLSSNAVTFNKSLEFDHLKVEPAGSDKSWTAEVLNLSRNVRIEGTENGKAHVFIKSSVPQIIKNVALRFLGPKTENIGRYALHFHHCMNGSIGSIVEDCVAYDQGSHCFVPHGSHGITFINCVAFNCLQEAYWWDERDVTHYTVYHGCLAALGTRSGFFLGIGDENSCINCVCVSAALGREGGSPNNSGAFFWEANNEGIWIFKNNLSHSNYNGLRVWQNTHKNHVIENYCSYNNMIAAFHGAYMNSYTYKYGYHYNSLFKGKATSSQTSGVRFEHVVFDAAGQDFSMEYSDSPIESWDEQTNKFYYCTFKNYTVAPIKFESAKPTNSDGSTIEVVKIKKYDLIHCDLGNKLPIVHQDVENGTRIRIQPKSGQVIKIEKVGTPDMSNGKMVVSNIAAFTAKVWGKGDGLTGEYFNGTIDFEESKKVVKRVDSIIAFNEWSTLGSDHPEMFHHKLNSDRYAVRWSGKLMAQYSEDYIFRCNSAGGIKLTVNGELIIDQWDAEPFNINDRFALISKSIKLEAGKSYDIVLEHCNRGGYRGCLLSWKSISMSQFEIIPQCQLYPSNAVVTDPIIEKPSDNIAPIAKAGDDVSITLPNNSVMLDGQQSLDSDGKITTYKWTKISGPDSYVIENASIASTKVKNLVEGEYIFNLEVKDNKGSITSDEVKVTVNAASTETKNGLVAEAGSDVTLKLPNNSFTLDGSSSSIAVGKINSYKWSKVSGPTQFTLSSASSAKTTLSNLVEGTYVFKLQITDDNGKTASDSIAITVNPAAVNQPPVALAGDDYSIHLPTDKAKLDAFASTDPDGTITSFKWTKVSGPASYSIENAAAASTVVSNLVKGNYTFRLEVKDDKGAVSTDEINISVKPKQEKVELPKVQAGNDIEITLPTNNVRLRGIGKPGSGGAITLYQWTKKSGPSKYKIVNPNAATTVINQLQVGTYVITLLVGDSSGQKVSDEVVITVLPKGGGLNDSNLTEESNKTTSLNVSVSPNPSTSVFKVHMNSNSDKPITLRLFDRWGKEVGVMKNVKSGATITIPNNLKRGTYFGVAEQGFQKKTMTLIKM